MLSVVEVTRGSHIIKKGTKLTHIFWLIKGSVRIETENAELVLKGGNVLGIPDCLGNTYKYDYVAEEDGKLYAIPYESPKSLSAIYGEKGYKAVFLLAVMNTTSQIAARIDKLLDEMQDLREDPEFPQTPEAFRQNFYLAYAKQPLPKIEAFFAENEMLMTGEILTAAKYLTRGIPALDNLEYYRKMIEETKHPKAPEPEPEPEELYEEEGEKELLTLSDNPLREIVEFVNMPKDKARELGDMVAQYRTLPDPNDTDDATRKLRRTLTNAFYEVYKAVFKRSIGKTGLPAAVILFLHFGLIDIDLCGKENAEKLLEAACRLKDFSSKHVYTLPQWLMSIYGGKNEPSKNEFDMDFEAYLRDEKKNGRMTEREAEEFRRDGWKKVAFEIDNMVKSNGRTTYGRVLTFCPMLSADDLIKDVSQLLLKARDLEAAIDRIKETDYSLFYHDSRFSDPEFGINVEMTKEEILPNIILMPNYGVRAMMWQETAGVRNNTPARFIFPILFDGELDDQMLLTCGRYRWEYCRKVEGARWNDVTEDSLTARYCDYLQFYRKNRELNPEIREKLHKALTRAKNNFREVFILDYLTWVRYETKGSLRLNKVTRDILFTHCPMSAACRGTLANNPNFANRIERWNNNREKDKKRLMAVIDRYREKGGTDVEPLLAMIKYHDL